MSAPLNPKPTVVAQAAARVAAQTAALWRRLSGLGLGLGLGPGRGLALPAWSRLGWKTGGARAVTVVMLGPRCAVVRLEARADGLHLVAAEDGEAGEGGEARQLARWKPLFKGSRGVLVLRSEERFLLTLDKPEVPEAELNLALRWPMGEALGTEPEQLLTVALPLPRVNEAVRAQVLGVATRLETAQGHLAKLRQAGVAVRCIDVVDSALRGMALLQETLPASTVAVCLVGNHMSIGLIQHGDICALRSVPLPDREGHADADLAEQLALNTRRTFDHYERQAMLSHRAADNPATSATITVGRALASVGSLSQAGLDTFCTALPDAPQLLDLAASLHSAENIALRCAGNDELTALVCVAAARLFDTGPVVRRSAAGHTGHAGHVELAAPATAPARVSTSALNTALNTAQTSASNSLSNSTSKSAPSSAVDWPAPGAQHEPAPRTKDPVT